jgi:hypothetical protein
MGPKYKMTTENMLNSKLKSKRRFCQHKRHPKIVATNFGSILPHSSRARKQKT